MYWPLRKIFRLIWGITTTIVILSLPVLIWYLFKLDYHMDVQMSIYGGIFVALTLPVTIYQVLMHLEYYTCPEIQKYVIRISLMVPVYSIVSWLGLMFFEARIYLDPLRECYEAFVIYSFYCYLCSYLQSKFPDWIERIEMKPEIDHMWGFQIICPRWRIGGKFLWNCRKGILNYVIIRPILALIGSISIACNFYNEGDLNGMWFWIFMINNFSQLWAIYCLIMFYRVTKRELEDIKPVAKFLLIKVVVFLTFWQSIAISLIFAFGWINTEGWIAYPDGEGAANAFQNFFICIQMFMAAILFAYVFPPRDYMIEGENGGLYHTWPFLFEMNDVVEDVSSVIGSKMSKSTDMTSGIVHSVGSFFKSPRDFFRYKKWRKKKYKRTPYISFDDSNAKLLSHINSLSSSFLIKESYVPPVRTNNSSIANYEHARPSHSEPNYLLSRNNSTHSSMTKHSKKMSIRSSSIASSPTFEIEHE